MPVDHTPPRLTRERLHQRGLARRSSPSRIVHMGVGAFHRAHQAWYTARASDAAEWGITGFTGRSTDVADTLAPQGGVYTLVERGPEADAYCYVDSIQTVHPGSSSRFAESVCDSATAVVTLTVTEAGYSLNSQGRLAVSDTAVAADAAVLRGDSDSAIVTPIARLTNALHLRHRAGGRPIAVVPCDNIPANGSVVRAVVEDFASLCGWDATSWAVSYVSTSVDRITPRTTAEDIRQLAEITGDTDPAAVITEPFSDWVLEGEFPAGRPDWAGAGARFVDDIDAYERRKLLMLNGGHLALAYSGLLRGHTTVADAMGDRVCRQRLEGFWDEAQIAVGGGAEVERYRMDLTRRFANARIAHHLSQIAVDTATKTRLRILPVISASRERGGPTTGASKVIRDWSAAVRTGLVAGDPSDLLASATAGASPEDGSLFTDAFVTT